MSVNDTNDWGQAHHGVGRQDGRDGLSVEEQMLRAGRAATARIVTAAIEATAQAAMMSREAHRRLNGDGSADEQKPQLDPQQLVDFAQSEYFDRLKEDYVAGRQRGHLLVRVMEVLRELHPALFGQE
jgi:hypothetical protein